MFDYCEKRTIFVTDKEKMRSDAVKCGDALWQYTVCVGGRSQFISIFYCTSFTARNCSPSRCDIAQR